MTHQQIFITHYIKISIQSFKSLCHISAPRENMVFNTLATVLVD